MTLSAPERQGALTWPSGSGRACQTELEIRNRLDELARAAAWLEDFVGRLDLPAETHYRLDLALAEAVTNVISYAFDDGAEHPIRLRLQADGEGVSLEVEDDGLPFDPLEREQPALPRTLEEAPIGGLGIHLIRSMLDECHYQRKADRNLLTMIARSRKKTG